jgi:hypothetical protein
MKAFQTITMALLALVLFQCCSPKPQSDTAVCMQGKLVKRGICGQYVVQLMGEPADGILYAQQWMDSMSHRSYENVFTIGNPCSFPASIKEGDSFGFTITQTADSVCIQCRAYTPTPSQRNNIVTGCK